MDTPAPTGSNGRPVLPGPPPKVSIVGIGASAGGVAALQRFFDHMPPDSGLAFVVIVHLSPEVESHLVAVLQPRTSMPVVQVTTAVRVVPNTVYVIPPTHDLAMADGMLHLRDPERAWHLPIDLFFRTLAESHGPQAFAVVLSGTGADGSVGITRIKETGGVAIAQAPTDAEYDSMPRHAISTGAIDAVLPVVEIPARVLTIFENARRIALPPEGDAPSVDTSVEAEAALRDTLALVRDHTTHDFTHYKRPTVLRRIERRMQVTTQPTLPAYRDYLRATPAEAQRLLGDLLIGVTNFFRDPEAFAALEHDIIPKLFAGKAPSDRLRVWVAGCATGEEAYSVAILLLEYTARLPNPPEIQVFATDIDAVALGVAREGRYSDAIATDVPPPRLQRFFIKEPSGYRVVKAVRERLLFAAHNLLNDPPFTHLDLVTCRNLLIYLQRDIQTRVFELFHFALNRGGWLFLGTSEGVDGADDLFAILNKPQRLFRATDANPRVRTVPALPLDGTRPRPRLAGQAERQQIAFGELHQRLLERYAPPSLIINADYDIVHLSERAGRFLQLGGGPPSLNVLKVVLPELRPELRTALYQAFATGRSTEARRVRIERDGHRTYINMVARPERDTQTDERYALVLFDEVDEILGTEGTGAEAGATEPMVRGLETEVQRLRTLLQATVEHQDITVEELKAANEELQASNEELRAMTEELETGKEELQSINEELRAVNDELKRSVDEVSQRNDDLHNLMGSTDIATLFLDRQLRITLFTPRVLDLFSLIAADVGRPLADIRSMLQYEALSTDAARVLEHLQPIEREVQTTTGSWYLTRLVPYRTGNDRISGVVLSCVDITAHKHQAEAIRQSEARLRLVLESVADYAIVTLDPAGAITSWNVGAARAFGYAEADVLGQPAALLFTPEDRALGAPEDEQRQAAAAGRAADERWHLRKDGIRFYVSGSLTSLRSESGALVGFVKIARDLTAERLAQEALEAALAAEQTARAAAEAALQMRNTFLSIASHELRTPLTSLLGYADLLRRHQTDRPEAAARMADVIVRKAQQVNVLIAQVLDVARLERSPLAVERQRVDLSVLTEHVVEELRVILLETTRQTLDLSLPGEPVIVVGDATRLEQVLHNLLNNAVKYSVAESAIQVRLTQTSDESVLEVADQGMGMSDETQLHLFELFYRAPNLGTAISGFGIGLYIVNEIVHQHGGRIEVVSTKGVGSTFRIILPRQASDELPTPAGSPTSP